MRLSILMYGVLYVVLEMVRHSLDTGRPGPGHAAARRLGLVDALLVIVVNIVALVLYDVGRPRGQGPLL